MTSTNPRGPIMRSRYWPVDDEPWRRASRCDTGACIGVRPNGTLVAFDSAPNPFGNLRGNATRAEFAVFIDAVKRGEFDDLAADDE